VTTATANTVSADQEMRVAPPVGRTVPSVARPDGAGPAREFFPAGAPQRDLYSRRVPASDGAE